MSFAYGVSRNYKEACNSLTRTREAIGEKYTRLAVLEKQIAAYHSVIDNYGSLIKAFCIEEDKEKKKAKRKTIYRKGKNRTLEADGYKFIRDETNPIILVQFYGFERKLFYQNKFDIDDDFKGIFEEYDTIKKELEPLPALCIEREKEVEKYDDIFLLSTNINTYSEDNAEKTFEELKRYYEEKLRYNKRLDLDIDLPDENGNEHARYRNRNQIRGLIKTLCAITAVCQENQIPLNIETGWHVDNFGYCDGVECSEYTKY